MPLDISVTNEQQVRITAAPVTATGNPASLDEPLRATVSAGDGTWLPGSTDLEIILVSGTNPGDTSYLIEGDADLGEGQVLVQDTVILHVTGAMAASMGLTASTPEAKAAA